MKEESFGVIVFQNGKKEVLLVRTDHWGFPKGHAAAHEDGLATALREVREETGLIASIHDPKRVLTDEYKVLGTGSSTKKCVTYWVGEAIGDPVAQEGEVHEARWVNTETALTLLSYESARDILKKLL